MCCSSQLVASGGWKFEVGYWTLEVEPVKPENLVAGKTKRIETEAQLGVFIYKYFGNAAPTV